MFPTNWNCRSRSISGQLQRATPSPSPKLERLADVLLPLELSISNSPKPEVKLSPRLALGMPKAVIAATPASGLLVSGLYWKYPKRKSPSSVELKVLVVPTAKL